MAPYRVLAVIKRRGVVVAGTLVMTLLAASAAVAAGTATWTPVRRLNLADQSGVIRHVAVAPDGTVHALLSDYTDGPYKLYATRHRPGGVWEQPALVSEGEPGHAAIAVAGDGTAVAAWSELVDAQRGIRTARRAPGAASWTVDSGYRSPAGAGVGEPRIVADAKGNVTAVWTQEAMEGDTLVQRVVATSRTANGQWSSPVAVSGPQAQDPSLVVDAAGRVTAAWDGHGGGDTGRRLIYSNRRTPTTTWKPPAEALVVADATHNQFDVDLAVAPAGALVAVWLQDTPTGYVIEAARKALGQPWVPASAPLSGVNAETPAAAMGPDGTAFAAWSRYDGTDAIIQASAGAPDGEWSDAQSLSASGADARWPDVVVDNIGVATAVWHREAGFNDTPIEARRYSAGTWSDVVTLTEDDDDGGIEPVAVVDAQGNVVVAWSAFGEIQARAYDVAGPLLASVTAPRATFSLHDPLVKWTARDAWNAVTSYRVEVASATATGAFSPRTPWLDSTFLTSQAYGTTAQGSTYCFTVRGNDSLGFIGPRSTSRCTATPLDDRRLAASAGWERRAISAAYLGTASVADAEGAALKSDPVDATRLALIATRAPDAGRVDVFFAGDLVKTISLKPTAAQDADRTYRKQVIPVATFAGRRSGAVRIVTKNDNRVVIEGLGVSAR